MQETLDKINRGDLVAIATELEEKSEFFQKHLDVQKIIDLNEETLTALFRKVFAVRRKTKVFFEKYTAEQYKHAIIHLLYAKEPLVERYQKFVDDFSEHDPMIMAELASELLHYNQPDKFWLWSRWLWDHNNNTGALPLVTNEEFKLEGNNYGDKYMSVGKAIAFVHSMAESAEFQFINRSLFGTDVFLSCVYVIYAYTVLKIKMTDEFNKVMPGLSEFSRRILGIYNSKEMTVVSPLIK